MPFFLNKKHKSNPAEIGDFYNTYFDAFDKVYGQIIQAFRTNDLSKLLDAQITQIGITSSDKLLDAGCGVCGPARYFAKQTGCQIEAITVSSKQAEFANKAIADESLANNIQVRIGDYHQVDEYYEKDSFDKVYFLESFGHSHDKEKLLKAVWKVLKPGGNIYIKDLFVRKMSNPILQALVYKEINKINKAYHYQVAELDEFINLVRKLGYIIEFVKTIDIPLEDFENLAISNEFQELTGIAQIKDWKYYVFPVDFFEVKLYKPEYDIEKGKHRYFLQNLFQIRIENLLPNKL